MLIGGCYDPVKITTRCSIPFVPFVVIVPAFPSRQFHSAPLAPFPLALPPGVSAAREAAGRREWAPAGPSLFWTCCAGGAWPRADEGACKFPTRMQCHRGKGSAVRMEKTGCMSRKSQCPTMQTPGRIGGIYGLSYINSIEPLAFCFPRRKTQSWVHAVPQRESFADTFNAPYPRAQK
jgi:hypothetical protein